MQVFSTPRLWVRKATPDDVDFYLTLWTSPLVMRFVGYPQGLPITRAEILELINKEDQDFPFGSLLVVVHKASELVVGECKMYRPGYLPTQA